MLVSNLSFSVFPQLAYTSLYISPIPPPFLVVCQMKWLLLSPTPSVVFSYSHLHVHALAVRPASRWDWSTTQRHVLLHVSRRQEPDSMGTYTRTHMCITRYTCNVNSPSSWTRTHTDTSGHVNLMCASVWRDTVEKMSFLNHLLTLVLFQICRIFSSQNLTMMFWTPLAFIEQTKPDNYQKSL